MRRFTQYWRNDYVGAEEWSRTVVRDHYIHLIALHIQHKRFAELWDRNLRSQGFAEVFDPQKHNRG
ncbi:DUF6908 domain-containing protein [Granulicella rosea]|uniref:DUF6908 domain-containing protein n=1 Tax=Granulicella rosea TaxID=474952 RepID=UPI003CCB9696